MKIKTSKQVIEFNKKQFLALLKTVYLGNWIANAYRTRDIQKEYEETEDYIFSYASKFGFDKYMDHEASDGKRYYPTSYFEEETDVHQLHEEYDENTMWDELAEKLGERDFVEKYPKSEVEKMSKDEFIIKLSECVDVYNEEFEKYGLERIRIKKD